MLALIPCLVAALLAQGRFDSEVPLAPGASAELPYRVESSGDLHVWAEGRGVDPLVAVVGDEHELGSDDDSGGGTSAWVVLAVEAGTRLTLRVSAKAGETAGAVGVHVRELPASDATRALAAELRLAIDESGALRLAGDHAAARQRLLDSFERLQATPGCATSASVIEASRRLMLDLYHLSEYAVAAEVAGWRDAAMEPSYPPDCDARLEARAQHADLLGAQGRSEESLALTRELVARYARSRPPTDRKRISVSIGLAQNLSAARQLDEAGAILETAVPALERAASDDPKLVATAKYVQAYVLEELGRYEAARDLSEQALATFRLVFGEDDPFRLSAELNHGTILSALGDHQEALATFERVLAVQERTLPADHADLGVTRMNLAVQLRALGNPELAAQMLEIQAAHASAATWSRTSLARLQLDRGVFANELGQHERALALLQPLLDDPAWRGADDQDLAWRVHTEIGNACDALGRSDDAISAARAGLDLLQRFYPPDAPDTIEAAGRLARLLARKGERSAAWPYAEDAALRAREFFVRRVASLSPRQAEALQFNWSRLVSDALDTLPACADEQHSERAQELAFELVEASRAIGSIALRMAREVSDPNARRAIEAHRGAIALHAREIAHWIADSDDAEQLVGHVRAKEDEERALRAVVEHAAGTASRLLAVDARAIAAALAPDEAGIGYWAYDDRSDWTSNTQRPPQKLAAFVLRPGRTPQRIELGSIAAVRAACEAWRDALDDELRLQEAGTALRKLVVDPLRAALGNAGTWRVALDDELHLVPLGALPEGAGRLEDGRRIMLTPTLVELALDRRPSGGVPTLVAVGGVDYDHAAARELSALPASDGDERSEALRGARRDDFEPLWETSEEVGAIAALYRARFAAAPAELLEERDATKAALVRLAPRATYLHVATHGFFAPERVPAVGDAPPPGFDVLSAPGFAVSVAGFSPMSLCGLALAGANADDPDGIVTAEELAALDLSRCELAVLSACDTAVGYLRAGQGIASFQKALHAAGARFVLTSLWTVSDSATRELMDEFYRALWIDGLAPVDALARAKRALRERRAPTREWAAWVLGGD